MRWIIEASVLLSIAGIMAKEFFLEGWPAPIVVSSGSMATTYLGPHRVTRCPDCGMEFACDAVGSRDNASATCPNCGRGGIELAPDIIAGDRLLIDRSTFAWRAPRRWEVALFRCPERASDYCIKRIVGLPGEAIEIRDGDVYVDGSIARKPLDRQREMAILVHDTAWSSAASDLPNRWSAQPDSGWQIVDGGWQCKLRSPSINWLNYVHWRRTAGGPLTIGEAPIRDEDGYNQTTSRQLNDVTDLMLVCQLSASGKGTLQLKARDGREEFQVSILPATGAIALARNGREVQSIQAVAGLLDWPTEVVLSLIDQQVVLAIGGRTELIYPYVPPSSDLHASSQPFSIGASGLEILISRLQIWRDVYYTRPIRSANSTICHLGPDEYFVLGDNSPISRDSRPWTGGEVLRDSLLVGRPLSVFRRREIGN
ncbi:MAG TPA: signal peptidase I [Pirellulales bacterium]|jgi:signal peptidase I|nr:signal peptidase I [Pirellulales bacterium]